MLSYDSVQSVNVKKDQEKRQFWNTEQGRIMKICPSCKTNVESGDFCPKCGKQLNKNMFPIDIEKPSIGKFVIIGVIICLVAMLSIFLIYTRAEKEAPENASSIINENNPTISIIAEDDSDENIEQKKGGSEESNVNDNKYYELLAKETNEIISNIYIHDYDGNGREEAFATTKSSDAGFEDYDNLWFISDDGAVNITEHGLIPQLLYTEVGVILVPWRACYGATNCYCLHHGQVKKLEIYTADIYQDEDTGLIYAVEEYFTANGEYHKNIECQFDADACELIYTDNYFESNPEEDETHFCWNRNRPDISDNNEVDYTEGEMIQKGASCMIQI